MRRKWSPITRTDIPEPDDSVKADIAGEMDLALEQLGDALAFLDAAYKASGRCDFEAECGHLDDADAAAHGASKRLRRAIVLLKGQQGS